MPVSSLAMATLSHLDAELEISEIRRLIEELWIETNIREGHSLLLDPLAEHHK